MGAKQSERAGITYLSLKAKTSDTDGTPFFGINEKVGELWTITKKFDAVDGHLTKISHSTYEYEGQTKYKVSMRLVDEDGTVTMLEGNFNNLSYSILNAIAGCDNPDLLDINLWLGKAKVDMNTGKEGKRYPSAKVKNNGADTKWKYEPSDLPRPIAEKFKGKTVMDDSDVIKFWCNVIDNEISPKLKDFTPTKAKEELPEKSAKIQPNVNAERSQSSGGDEIPVRRDYTPLEEMPTDDGLPF